MANDDTEKKKDSTPELPGEEDEKVTPLEIALIIVCAILLVVIVVMFLKLRR